MTIKIGDLVWVAENPICGCSQSYGMVFQVTALVECGNGCCHYCKAPRPEALLAFILHGYGIEAYRLRVIPPKEELDRLIEEKEFTKELELIQ